MSDANANEGPAEPESGGDVDAADVSGGAVPEQLLEDAENDVRTPEAPQD